MWSSRLDQDSCAFIYIPMTLWLGAQLPGLEVQKYLTRELFNMCSNRGGYPCIYFSLCRNIWCPVWKTLCAVWCVSIVFFWFYFYWSPVFSLENGVHIFLWEKRKHSVAQNVLFVLLCFFCFLFHSLFHIFKEECKMETRLVFSNSRFFLSLSCTSSSSASRCCFEKKSHEKIEKKKSRKNCETRWWTIWLFKRTRKRMIWRWIRSLGDM